MVLDLVFGMVLRVGIGRCITFLVQVKRSFSLCWEALGEVVNGRPDGLAVEVVANPESKVGDGGGAALADVGQQVVLNVREDPRLFGRRQVRVAGQGLFLGHRF